MPERPGVGGRGRRNSVEVVPGAEGAKPGGQGGGHQSCVGCWIGDSFAAVSEGTASLTAETKL